MSQQSSLTRVEKVICETVTLPENTRLHTDTELFTLGVDSLTTINLLLALANDYQVELESFISEIDTLKTVGDLCLLAEKFAAAAPVATAANIKFFAQQTLHYEYGLDGIRTFPWEGVNTPIGSGYCIVRPFTETLPHINQPNDEEELFIGVQGEAVVVIDGKEYPFTQGDQVFIPRGSHHFVRNNGDNSFHFFTIWWNQAGARAYLAQFDKAGQ
ncbi:cupin domain-containing protein [Salmonella enterica subsp. enterica]|nr:cupin domain-containing protein [Salmonella enterica]EBQ9479961.1 cupin [Salmonella enterica subsp. enterica serovar Kokomlemle]ECS5198534.1 cupin domain-containing protein [Salmonella enterica subsp. enterica serovar Poano]EBJ7122026.1 cupin domain-containing protein [Salmonella enterica]ECX4750927.1 cupin domain-containing protein [Salmonella enterica]